MITADSLARELGCTLADLEDLDPRLVCPPRALDLFTPSTADAMRAEWSELTGIDYTETVK